MQQKINDLFKKLDSSESEDEQILLFLQDLISLLRKINDEDPNLAIEELIDFLKNNEEIRSKFAAQLNKLFTQKNFVSIITDVAIPQASDFFFEVKEKIVAKFIPNQPPKDNLAYYLNHIFHRSSDAEWTSKISEENLFQLAILLELTPLQQSIKEEGSLLQILYSLEILTLRSSGKAMQSRVVRMVPEYNNLESPFVSFQDELSKLQQQLVDQPNLLTDKDNIDYKQLNVLLQQCKDFVDRAYKNAEKFGISLRVNQDLLRIRQQLERIEEILPFLVAKDTKEQLFQTAKLFQKLILLNSVEDNLGNYLGKGTQLIAHEITQQTANTGEHYITSNKKEYFKMFLTALGGGMVVGLMWLTKTLLYKVEISDFGKAFLMSMNYSLGFVILYLLSFTLATKQPAMTASTLVEALEKGFKKDGNLKNKYQAFANLFARVFRSQFIAFVGNVLMAFPVALGAVYLLTLAIGDNLVAYRSEVLLEDLHMLKSPLLAHAGIAGIYLFLSGIIAGVIANRNKFNNFYYRIQEHPYLKRKFGVEKTKKLASFIERKWPGIMSNFWFGVFMGSTGAIGNFFGLDLGIRHIAFASGNFALGVFGEGMSVPVSIIMWSLIGIVLIGFVNFAVSFSLSMILAFKSRKIPLKEFVSVIKSVISYFKEKPMRFIIPISTNEENNEAID